MRQDPPDPMTASEGTHGATGDPSIADQAHDEGGDPACWAHLFDEDVENVLHDSIDGAPPS
jgi:hypothetical protein